MKSLVGKTFSRHEGIFAMISLLFCVHIMIDGNANVICLSWLSESWWWGLFVYRWKSYLLCSAFVHMTLIWCTSTNSAANSVWIVFVETGNQLLLEFALVWNLFEWKQFTPAANSVWVLWRQEIALFLDVALVWNIFMGKQFTPEVNSVWIFFLYVEAIHTRSEFTVNLRKGNEQYIHDRFQWNTAGFGKKLLLLEEFFVCWGIRSGFSGNGVGLHTD